jgi:hypothetical protein
MRRWASFVVFLAAVSTAASVGAIPAVQLGPGSGNWFYDNTTQTWLTTDNPLNLSATANSDGAAAHGDYAWDPAGSGDQTAYLVVAAQPKINIGDAFDITVVNDGASLFLVESGFGTPPLGDPNALPSHGIFDTYYEVYAFDFDEDALTIFDTQPGMVGSGEGYVESFDITLNSLAAGVDNVHFDLFTTTGDGSLGSNSSVKAFAPHSHDAGTAVPEPSSALLLGVALLAVQARVARR